MIKQKSLIEVRNSKNISQTKMAELLGISIPSYNLYEHGGRRIPKDIVEKISVILELNEEEKNRIFLPMTFALRKTNFISTKRLANQN